MKKKTINITVGKEEQAHQVPVDVIYTAACERNYERITDHSISQIDFTKISDLITLSMACVIATYEIDGKDVPITANTLLYDADSNEVAEMFAAVIELRNDYYHLPEKVKQQLKAESESIKAAGDEQKSATDDPNA